MNLKLDEGLTEETLLKELQTGDVVAFGKFLRLWSDPLTEYTNTKLKSAGVRIVRGTDQFDILASAWHSENFARATNPLSRWILDEIDRVIGSIRHTTRV
jgi:hypothetical protein